jgi:hypothetical protein
MMETNDGVEKTTETVASSNRNNASKTKPEISKRLKTFDFVLAGISLAEFLWKIITKFSGTPRGWLEVLLSLFLAIGLVTHEKWARVFCIILLVISFLYPLIIGGIIAGSIGY